MDQSKFGASLLGTSSHLFAQPRCSTCDALIGLLAKEKESAERLRTQLQESRDAVQALKFENLERENQRLREELREIKESGGVIDQRDRDDKYTFGNQYVNWPRCPIAVGEEEQLYQSKQQIQQEQRRRDAKVDDKAAGAQAKINSLTCTRSALTESRPMIVLPDKLGKYQTEPKRDIGNPEEAEEDLLNGSHSSYRSRESSYHPLYAPRPRITARKRSTGAPRPNQRMMMGKKRCLSRQVAQTTRNLSQNESKIRNAKGQFTRTAQDSQHISDFQAPRIMMHSVSIDSADLRNDGRDEVIMQSPNSGQDEIAHEEEKEPISILENPFPRLKCPAPHCQATRGLVQSMKQHIRETKGGQGHGDVYCGLCDSVFFRPNEKEEHDRIPEGKCPEALRLKNKAYLSLRQKSIVRALEKADVRVSNREEALSEGGIMDQQQSDQIGQSEIAHDQTEFQQQL